jgi:uncharacterized protein with von Willebrand factor type A (vWA) domain
MTDIDYDSLIEQHCEIINTLSQEADTTDEKSLTNMLRNTGLALGNLAKLKTLKKREIPEEEDDNSFDEMMAKAQAQALDLKERHGISKAKPAKG